MKNSSSIVRDYAEELSVSPTNISHNLKLIGKFKKMDMCVPDEMNENHKPTYFEIPSTLLLRRQNKPFFSPVVTCDEM